MALQKPSPGLLPAENYSRFGRAFDAVDKNAADIASAAQQVATIAGQKADKATVIQIAADLSTKAPASALPPIAADAAQAVATSVQASRMAPPSIARPGDGLRAFTFVPTLTALGGEADALAPLDASLVAFGSAGGVARLTGQGILAAREAEAVEPGRIREVRAALRRRSNTSDPANNGVRFGVLWLDQAKNPLPGAPVGIISDMTVLLTTSGRRTAKGYISASEGLGVTLVAPAGAVYFRRLIYVFGLDGTTDVEDLASSDVTSLIIPPVVTTAFEGRLAAQESQNAGPRLGVLEAAVQNPNSVTYKTLSDAKAASPPVTATTLVLKGRVDAGDGLGGEYKRVALIATGAIGFQSADGANWQRVDLPEVLNFLDFPGADPTGATEQGALIQAAMQRAKDLGRGFKIPYGTFKLEQGVSPPRNMAYELGSSTFVNTNGATVDGTADFSPLYNGRRAAKTLHKITDVGGTETTLFVTLDCRLSSDPKSYIKGAGYFYAVTSDTSAYNAEGKPISDAIGLKDAVGLISYARIRGGTQQGRAFAGNDYAVTDTDSDGILVGREIDLVNRSGVDAPDIGGIRAKTGLLVASLGTNSGTEAITIAGNGAGGRWHYGLNIYSRDMVTSAIRLISPNDARYFVADLDPLGNWTAKKFATLGDNSLSIFTGDDGLARITTSYGDMNIAPYSGRKLYLGSTETIVTFNGPSEYGGTLTLFDDLRLVSKAPAGPNATGKAGTITFDGTRIYVCWADNHWNAFAASSWS